MGGAVANAPAMADADTDQEFGGTACHRLKMIGILSRVARNRSLMEIASELPVCVFSRLLRFYQSTARRLGREWLHPRPVWGRPGESSGT
ncbi:hypothetical protein ACFU7X_06455 [Streptomyces chartreusis]|uniref:hypothetical protein n=1 Tax=Streptomyces chartreusis TaxID=1969 RepID=UPI00369C3243